MIRFLADENFSNRILRGIRREVNELDVVRVQDTAIYGADDATVLEWAAQENRILLTHDISTIPKYAYERVGAGLLMTGVIAIPLGTPIGVAIDDMLLIIGASASDEYENQVVFLPLT
ncbi:MAG: hypothetical protein CL610_25020 [Anaerolineaceae bacterium]|nr:hypothetical protein [Anaerolineaceae bacterium]